MKTLREAFDKLDEITKTLKDLMKKEHHKGFILNDTFGIHYKNEHQFKTIMGYDGTKCWEGRTLTYTNGIAIREPHGWSISEHYIPKKFKVIEFEEFVSKAGIDFSDKIIIAKDSQYPVEVYNDRIRIKCNGSENHSDNIIIRKSELKEIYEAHQSLQ